MDEFIAIIANISWRDWVDILIVGLLFFGLFLLLRQTRSAEALRGLMAVLLISFFLFFAASAMQFSATALIFRSFWIVGVLVFLIVFQQDFRRALISVGRMPVFRVSTQERKQSVLEVVSAAQRLAEKKVGALICFERSTSLKVFADTGIALDSQVSAELLRTLFAPYTPLHDGAVILSGDRILAAGCILPVAEETPESQIFGMRHRAALGLSQETDAVVIVVSEETGIISLVIEGRMERGLNAETLSERLVASLGIRSPQQEPSVHETA